MSELDKLKDFAKVIIAQSVFDGSDLSGGEIQDIAVAFGFLKKVPFDPKKHRGQGSEYTEKGDDWYEFSGPLSPKPNDHKE